MRFVLRLLRLSLLFYGICREGRGILQAKNFLCSFNIRGSFSVRVVIGLHTNRLYTFQIVNLRFYLYVVLR